MAFKDAQVNGTFCPLLKETCIENKCSFWTHVRGKLPQSEEVVDKYGCAIAWMPILLIENAQMSNQTGAAVESMRNAVVSESEKNREVTQQLVGIELKKLKRAEDSNGKLSYFPDEHAIDAEFTED